MPLIGSSLEVAKVLGTLPSLPDLLKAKDFQIVTIPETVLKVTGINPILPALCLI
jgi:hypothetical protein